MNPALFSPRHAVAFLLVILLHAALFWTFWHGRGNEAPPPLKTVVAVRLIETAPGPRAPDVKPARPKTAARPRSDAVPQVEERPPESPPSDTAITVPAEPAAEPSETPPKASASGAAQPAAPDVPSNTAPRFDAAYLNNPAPAYPPLSRRRGEQGKVVLRVHVGADGSADAIELGTSSGSSRLDEAAIKAVRAWRFVPATQGGTPVAAWVLVPVNFLLENK